MAERKFKLCESFNIDNGELDGLSPQNCFVLGYELADVLRIAARADEIRNHPVHVNNMERITSFLTKRDFAVKWQYPTDDSGEEWVYLNAIRPELYPTVYNGKAIGRG